MSGIPLDDAIRLCTSSCAETMQNYLALLHTGEDRTRLIMGVLISLVSTAAKGDRGCEIGIAETILEHFEGTSEKDLMQ